MNQTMGSLRPANHSPKGSNGFNTRRSGQTDMGDGVTPNRKNLNIDSENDIASQVSSEFDSNASDFLLKKIPPINPGKPACFCVKGGDFCPDHNGKDVKIVDIVELLRKQCAEIEKDENEQNQNLVDMDQEIQEIFVSRQDTFKEKIVQTYIGKSKEVNNLREENDGLKEALEQLEHYKQMNE